MARLPVERMISPHSPTKAAAYFKTRGFDISARTVDRMIKRGELEAYVTAGGWQRVRLSELDRWIVDHS
jgi:excisionase family DNA binding protein